MAFMRRGMMGMAAMGSGDGRRERKRDQNDRASQESHHALHRHRGPL
jgi:hypothetical protein